MTTKSSFQSCTRPGRRSLTTVRPLRPTTSPMKRIRTRQSLKSMISRSVNTRSSRASRGVLGTSVISWAAKRNADRGDGLHRAQARDRHVVIAGAITEPIAGAVERKDRHDQNIGEYFRRFGLRLADAPDAGAERLTERPGAHDQRRATALNHGERQLGAGIGGTTHERERTDFELERRIAGDDGARRNRNRQSARGDRLRGRALLHHRQRFAARAALLAQLGFAFGNRIGSGHCVARRVGIVEGAGARPGALSLKGKCGPRWPSERRSRVPYESRWAPYVRAHEPGQGQLPSGSIRPRGYGS